MQKRFDVLGLGCATVDDFLYVPSFPQADAKTRVLRKERQCGGLTATALVAAARLGARCAYGGVLGDGDDALSATVEEALRREGVDVSHVVRRADAMPIHSIVVVGAEGHTRNIFFHLGGRTGADESLPADDVIRSAGVLFVDHYGVAGSLRAIAVARAAGVPTVADLERDDVPGFPDLLAAVDHLIVSERFALRLTGTGGAADAVRRLADAARGLRRAAVVVTCGERGCWYASRETGGEVAHQPAFPVDVADTTGCGDVFHGAYAAALAAGRPIVARVRFAAAAAALKATHPGGQRGIPFLPQVEALLGGDETAGGQQSPQSPNVRRSP